jgi:hypothetical protein
LGRPYGGELVVVGLDEALIELILLMKEVLYDLAELQAALLAVILHVLEAPLILREYQPELLVVVIGFNIRYDGVSDHLGILTEAEGAEGLLQLTGRGRDAKHNGGTRVASEGGAKDLG